MKNICKAAIAICVLASFAVRADVKVNSIFCDKLVLQRGKPVPVWGWATPGEIVTVSFAGKEKSATTDDSGKWMVKLDPLEASADGRVMQISGKNKIEIKDVLVGEVWFLSGQSNMALVMNAIAIEPRGLDKESTARVAKDIKAANDPLLREYRAEIRAGDRPREDTGSRRGWMTWNAQVGGEWAAMAAYFGERMRQQLNMPIGIVLCAWGGSGASSWTSTDALRTSPLNEMWPEDVVGWRSNIAPSRLYNGMLRPLAPFAISGFVWYQGETEATPYANPFVYRYTLAAMIQDWRRTWRDDKLPFYVIQLPNRNNEPRWVIVRESQAVAAKHTGATLMPTIDIGQAGDLHPKNKYVPGFRLADLVLAKQYGKETWSGAPSFDREAVEGDAIRVTFKDVEKGLKTSDDKAPANFQIAGDDHVFKPAEAKIDGSSVIVRSAEVKKPVAVRYAWESAPVVNLTGAGGLPVIPFRSDDFIVDGQEGVGQKLTVKEKLASITLGKDLIGKETGAWKPSPEVVELGGPTSFYFKATNRSANILVRNRAVRPGLPPSPPLYWTAEPEFDASKGITVEAAANVGRAGNYERGLDIELGIKQKDNTFRRYLVTAFPTRICTFQPDEMRVLRSDLDNGAAVYRIALRADGIAQIYRDGELIGITTGDVIKADSASSKTYVRVGKTVTSGEWGANIFHVAFDSSGAFMPPASLKTAVEDTGNQGND